MAGVLLTQVLLSMYTTNSFQMDSKFGSIHINTAFTAPLKNYREFAVK